MMLGKIWETVKNSTLSTLSVLFEAIWPVLCLFQSLLAYIGDAIEFILPYIMLWLGGQLYEIRGKQTFGGELFIPIVVFFIISVIRVCANRANKGKRVPVPHKRFTQVDEDGEVSIENSRIQELILYMADLEDWFHRRGWL